MILRNLSLALVLLISSISFGQAIPVSAEPHKCGSERTAVKTLADNIRLNELIVYGNVKALRALPAPKKVPNDLPRLVAEKQQYRVHAWLLGFKLEDDDEDYHLVISEVGDASLTMIAEIPSPGCAPKYGDLFQKEREFVAGLPMPKREGKMHLAEKPIEVIIDGVLFYDHPHGQTGVAPNAVELHPVTRIELAK